MTYNHSYTHSPTDGGVSLARRQPARQEQLGFGRCLAQGHLDNQLGGTGDRTRSLPVTSQTALPPDLLPQPKAQFRPKIHLHTHSAYKYPKMADFWPEEREENLIRLLEEQPVLNDVGSKGYSHRDSKKKACCDIAVALGVVF